MSTFLYILAIILLVFANGFFVAAEFALVGVRRSRIEALAAEGNLKARRLLGILNNLNAYLSASQLGITLASLALGWIGEPTVAHILEGPLSTLPDFWRHAIALFIAFSLITTLHIVLGEQAPKLLGLERAERVALSSGWTLHTFYRIFSWPIRALDWASARTVRLFGLHASSAHASIYTEEELRQIIESSRKGGQIKAGEQQLINRVFDFADTEVNEAMVPRTAVEALPVTATLEEARAAFRATGYSRLPVYRERLDEVVGVLFRKDLDMGQVRPDEFDLERIVRPPTFIPATATLGSALGLMQSNRVHLTFVLDEYGGLEGILTLEDLLEEIVGEINDEFDEEVRGQIIKDDGTYVLDGMLAVRDANQRLGLKLPEENGFTTMAGFLLARAGRLLEPGDVVEHEGALFKVERVERRRIRRIRFTPQQEPKPATGETASLNGLLPLVGAASLVARVTVEWSAHAQSIYS
ncbi:MAG TPA: hemolysin family protein [Pyrinomonadaceae bacterium]|nr:hemolysin family protein [Pyrinomonadaceae bacterium]